MADRQGGIMRRILLFSLLGALIAAGAQAAEPAIKPIAHFRWRQEVQDTLNNKANPTNRYGYGNVRARFGADIGWKMLTLHGLGQAAMSYNVPNDAPFGPGLAYFSNSDNETSPRHLRVAELGLIAKIDGLTVNVGRQGITEGLETLTTVNRFDVLKRERLAERLIGNLDWPNVGRRFDGASVNYNANRWNVAAFGARVLQGGFDYPNAFDPRDGTATGGIAFTAKRDAYIPQSEARAFYIQYRDAATSTEKSLGDRLLIHTVGVSWMGVYAAGPGAFDLLLWDAFQFGDYGTQRQRANAFLAEAGYGWPTAPWAPWLRAGLARASGDDSAGDGDNGTFFNMAPANHKFYGYQDLNALQNLTDLFAELRLEPTPKIKAHIQEHLFRVTNTFDGWYNGSGPVNNASLGFTRRFPAGSAEISRTIGTETDLTLSYSPHKRANFLIGASRFVGGAAVKTLFPGQSFFNLFYFQTTLQF